MAKDPAFLFYSNDFLTGTYTMTDEQVGKYIRLLCLQHQKGFLTEKDMLKICGIHDEDIISKFVKINNVYYNQRLKDEADKRNAYTESRRNNKLKGRNLLTSENISLTHEEDMENEDENINENISVNTESVVNQVFTDAVPTSYDLGILNTEWQNWKEYKDKHHKFKYKTIRSEILALKNLKELSHGEPKEAIRIINQSISNGWKGLFAIAESKSTNKERYTARVDYANRHNS